MLLKYLCLRAVALGWLTQLLCDLAVRNVWQKSRKKRWDTIYRSIYTMASGEKGVRGLTTLWCRGLRENPNRLSRQKSLNKIQKIKQKPTEDPSEFLERLHQAYTCYTDRDPETRENVRMINKTFIRQSTPEITKLWKWIIWNEPFSISRCCF